MLRQRRSVLDARPDTVTYHARQIRQHREARGAFNLRRLLEPIRNIPPADTEERYFAMLDDTPMAS